MRGPRDTTCSRLLSALAAMVGFGVSACPRMSAIALLIAAMLFSAAAEPANGLRMPTSLKSLCAPLRDMTFYHHKKCIPTQVKQLAAQVHLSFDGTALLCQRHPGGW